MSHARSVSMSHVRSVSTLKTSHFTLLLTYLRQLVLFKPNICARNNWLAFDNEPKIAITAIFDHLEYYVDDEKNQIMIIWWCLIFTFVSLSTVSVFFLSWQTSISRFTQLSKHLKTERFQDKSRKETHPIMFHVVAQIVVCSLVCVGYVLGTVGNYLVCSVVYSDPTMQTVLHLILVNLAAAGLICCLLNLPITFSLFCM